MHGSCGKHHLQGVWGRATPPVGSARGKARSHLQSNISCGGKRQASFAGARIAHPVGSARSRARSHPRYNAASCYVAFEGEFDLQNRHIRAIICLPSLLLRRYRAGATEQLGTRRDVKYE
jgi:hypothetical protein